MAVAGLVKFLDEEGRLAGGLLAGLGTFGDFAAYDVVSGGESGGVDGGACVVGVDDAAGGVPGEGELLFGVVMQDVGRDGDGVAGIDGRGLGATAEHESPGWFKGAEAQDDTAAELDVVEDAEAAIGAGCVEQAVVHVGVLEVGLEGTNGEVVEGDVDATAAGDAPAPGKILIGWAVGALAAAEEVDEGNDTAEGQAEERSSFGGVDQLTAFFGKAGAVGLGLIGGEVSALEVDAGESVEEIGEGDGGVGVVDNGVRITVDAAVIDRVEVAVAAVDVDPGVVVRRRRLNVLRGEVERRTQTQQGDGKSHPWHQGRHSGSPPGVALLLKIPAIEASLKALSLKPGGCGYRERMSLFILVGTLGW
jgi:hypothetical protein